MSQSLSGSSDAPPPVDCGYWGCIDSSVDWCEANYVVLPFVAEFLNTVSSLAITGIVIAGWFAVKGTNEVVNDWAFRLAYVAVASVGVGSALFHGTLRHYPQYFDEVPMLMAAACFIYIMLRPEYGVRENGTSANWLAFSITLVTAAAIGTYVFLDIFFVFFAAYFLGCAFLVLYPTLSTGCFSRHREHPSTQAATTLFKIAAVFYHCGFAAWVWEHFRCLHDDGSGKMVSDPDRGWETKIVPFHSLWHIFAGLGSTYYINFLVAQRAGQLGKTTIISTRYLCCACPANQQDPADDGDISFTIVDPSPSDEEEMMNTRVSISASDS